MSFGELDAVAVRQDHVEHDERDALAPPAPHALPPADGAGDGPKPGRLERLREIPSGP